MRVVYLLSIVVLSIMALCSSQAHGQGAEAATGDRVLIGRETIELPAWSEVADRPLIHLYTSETEYDRARSNDEFVFERLTYASDGLEVVALLYRPKKIDSPLPTIVFNRGSYIRNDTAPEYVSTFNRLAAGGYVILAPMYRGSEGADGRDEMGGDELNDLMRIPALADELSAVDRSNLFLLGESRGGMMVLQAIRDGFPAHAAAVYGAPTDFHRLFDELPAQYEPIADQLWPGWRDDREALLDRRSAMRWADAIDVPLLIMHGGNDESMPVSQSLNLAARLEELNKVYELHVFAYGNHPISRRAAERDASATAWYRAHQPE